MFWGPQYVPPFPSQVFAGPQELPRYGPPAAYQHLPAGWVPNPPPGPIPQPLYLEPLPYFNPELFDGLQFSTAYMNDESSEDRTDNKYVDTNVDEQGCEVTDRASENFEGDAGIGLDGSEGGDNKMEFSCCSNAEMEYSGDEAALFDDTFLFYLDLD